MPYYQPLLNTNLTDHSCISTPEASEIAVDYASFSFQGPDLQSRRTRAPNPPTARVSRAIPLVSQRDDSVRDSIRQTIPPYSIPFDLTRCTVFLPEVFVLVGNACGHPQSAEKELALDNVLYVLSSPFNRELLPGGNLPSSAHYCCGRRGFPGPVSLELLN